MSVETSIENLKKINGLDVARGIAISAGKPEFYLRIIRMACDKSAPHIARMDAQTASGDAAAFAIDIHGMKGAMANVGANALAAIALELELKAKQGEIDLPGYTHYKEEHAKFVAAVSIALS